MEKHERSDPTFPIFVVLASIFIVVLMVVTFPRHDGPVIASSSEPAATKK